jgi:hypothetical protein
MGGDVEVLEFSERGPRLAVRPYTHTDNYWQVFFDTNQLICSERLICSEHLADHHGGQGGKQGDG